MVAQTAHLSGSRLVPFNTKSMLCQRRQLEEVLQHLTKVGGKKAQRLTPHWARETCLFPRKGNHFLVVKSGGMWNPYQYYNEIIFFAASRKPVIDFILWCGQLQIHILVVTQLCSWHYLTRSWLETLSVCWQSGTSMTWSSSWSTEIAIVFNKQGLFLAGKLLSLDLTMERPDLHLKTIFLKIENNIVFYGKASDFFQWRQPTQQLKGATWGHIWTRALELKRELVKWKTRKSSKCNPKLKKWKINTRN